MARHAISAADREFRAAFESCSIDPALFNHRAHLRLAYVYLCEMGDDAAVARVRTGIHRLLTHLGVDPSAKYHETLTRAWILAVRHFMNHCGDTVSADAFIDASPALLDSKIMLTHYSESCLYSDAARSRFVEPDREPIPCGAGT